MEDEGDYRQENTLSSLLLEKSFSESGTLPQNPSLGSIALLFTNILYQETLNCNVGTNISYSDTIFHLMHLLIGSSSVKKQTYKLPNIIEYIAAPFEKSLIYIYPALRKMINNYTYTFFFIKEK